MVVVGWEKRCAKSGVSVACVGVGLLSTGMLRIATLLTVFWVGGWASLSSMDYWGVTCVCMVEVATFGSTVRMTVHAMARLIQFLTMSNDQNFSKYHVMTVNLC